jgi:hypothetical protein
VAATDEFDAFYDATSRRLGGVGGADEADDGTVWDQIRELLTLAGERLADLG